jgi:hypothetical protein
MRTEASYRSAGAAVFVAGATFVIGGELIDYGVQFSEIRRREVVITAAIGSLSIEQREQQSLRARIAGHFRKELDWLRARRPQLRD